MFRKGQWVKLRRDVDGEPAGTVGIHVGPIATPEGWDPTKRYCEVHLVFTEATVRREMVTRKVKDERTGTVDEVRTLERVQHRGGDTRVEFAIAEEDLLAVSSIDEIPADRRATLREDWTPKVTAGQPS